MNNVIASKVGNIPPYKELQYHNRFDSLANNEKVIFLMAALDLYLELTGESDYSFMKIGSAVPRYFGMETYTDLIYISNLLAYKGIYDFIEWTFHAQMELDIHQIIFEAHLEEFGTIRSYLPYCQTLRLCTKSPYCAAANKTLHTVIYGVGALFGMQRSQRSIFLSPGSLTHAAINITIIYLGNRHAGSLAKKLIADVGMIAEAIIAQGGPEAAAIQAGREEISTNRGSATALFTKCNDRNFAFNQEEINLLRRTISTITDCRERSIGHWITTTFLTLLPTEPNVTIDDDIRRPPNQTNHPMSLNTLLLFDNRVFGVFRQHFGIVYRVDSKEVFPYQGVVCPNHI
uniref:Rhabdovirus nucleocapsid domain-containing protein n=1 Tax=Glossina palpalis gambiensis TaxID=67801 RepID=A0A1B0BJQ4_9MUSC